MPSPVAKPQLRKNPLSNTKHEGFWIYGRHATLSALANPERSCTRLLLTAASSSLLGEKLLRTYHYTTKLPQIEIVERSVIERMLPGATHQGIAAHVTPLKTLPLNTLIKSLDKKKHAKIIVLDQITDPRNVGAVMRSAAAFGAMAVVMQKKHSPVENGILARAASGSLEKIPLARTSNLARTLETFKAVGFWVIGLEATASLPLAQIKARDDRIVLVLGSEGRGIRHLVRVHCDSLARLPIKSAVESLNVSNAAAVALYELTRFRFIDSHQESA